MTDLKKFDWRGSRRAASILVVGVVASTAFVACGDSSSDSIVAPEQQQSLAREMVGTQPVLIQYRDCDRSTSIYTVDTRRAVAMGEGASRQGAISNTIENAIKDEASRQFVCNDCPDEFFPEPCADYFGTIAMGGAELADPDADCEKIDGTWYCFGWVEFDQTPGSVSWAQAGCDVCDDAKVPDVRIEQF